MQPRLSRRRFLRSGLAAGVAPLVGWPSFLLDRPVLTHGVASGDVSGDRATIWCRADRPSRVVVEVDTTPSFARAVKVAGPPALDVTDLTSHVHLRDLPSGQDVFYRVTLVDLGDLRTRSVPIVGHLRTPGSRDVTLLWSADTAGQGFGINPDDGGMRTYRTMLREDPDLFIHCGDTIYADGPIPATRLLSDGTRWRNLTNEAVAREAASLHDYRARHRYNREDEHLRRFAEQVGHVVLWDDHEVRNNWYPDETMYAPVPLRPSVALRTAWGKRAFFEHLPVRAPASAEHVYRHLSWGSLLDVFVLDMRCARSPNGPGRGGEEPLLGEEQLAWIRRKLSESTAAWKVIATSLPLGLVLGDSAGAMDGAANGDGPPTGRELEVARLLSHIRERGVRNVVFLTGDLHYAAALHYHPDRARFTDFDPFWEFVAGPLHAETFGSDVLDDTFGPKLVYRRSTIDGVATGAPWDGMQFYGKVHIDGRSRAMTVSLHDREGERLWSVELPPVTDPATAPSGSR